MFVMPLVPAWADTETEDVVARVARVDAIQRQVDASPLVLPSWPCPRCGATIVRRRWRTWSTIMVDEPHACLEDDAC